MELDGGAEQRFIGNQVPSVGYGSDSDVAGSHSQMFAAAVRFSAGPTVGLVPTDATEKQWGDEIY